MGDFVGHPFRGNQWTDGRGGTGPEAQHTALSRGDYHASGGGRPWRDSVDGRPVTGTGQGLRPKMAPAVHEDPEGDARVISAGREIGVDVIPDGDGVPLSQVRRGSADTLREDVGPYGNTPGSKNPVTGEDSLPLDKLSRAEQAEVKAAREAVGRLSAPSKMPCMAWGLPATACQTGSVLAQIPGTACDICYARKGRYIFGAVKAANQRRLDTWKNTPDEVFVENFTRALKGEKYFRWFDTGDVQGERMLNQIVEIARRTPGVQHWMPTKEAHLINQYLAKHPEGFPKNLQVRLSLPLSGVDPVKLPRRAGQVPRAGILKQGASCPASNQGGNCGRCRKCWTNSDVTYKEH